MSKPGFLARHGATLIDNGYRIIPIRSGTKRPPFKDWEQIVATHETLDTWIGPEGKYNASGVGILSEWTPAADIDCLDAEAADHMHNWIDGRVEGLNFPPVRIGNAPKKLLLFRAIEPFSKINSKIWLDPNGDPSLSKTQSGVPNGHWRKVEMLGRGQQFVAYAIHPETGRPFEWVDNGSPLTRRVEDLPVLTQQFAREIADEFNRYAERRGWTLHNPSKTTETRTQVSVGKIDTDDAFASDAPKVHDLTPTDLRKRLMMVPGAEDYDLWVQIGMALWHQFDGSQEGLDLWHDWSAQAVNYDREALNARWPDFDPEGKHRQPVTARLIIKLAKENERVIAVEKKREIENKIAQCSSAEDIEIVCAEIQQIEFSGLVREQIISLVRTRFKDVTSALMPMSLARRMTAYQQKERPGAPEWLDGFCYLSMTRSFYHRKRQTLMEKRAFNDAYSRFMLTKAEVLEGKTVPEHEPANYALNAVQVPVVRNVMYMPGEEDIFSVDGQRYVNSYSAANVPAVPKNVGDEGREAISRVLRHVEHLFADERDRTILLDAIAFLVQNPGKRLNWAIVMQGVEGDGKSFFAGLLAAMLGPDNVNNIRAESAEEKFNAWAEGVQVVFFEEIKLHGHNRYDVLNKIKPLITNIIVPIRKMQTDVYSVINTATYFLTTNFRDALPLDKNDSRYFILFSRWQDKAKLDAFEAENPDYYMRLFASLAHGGALRKYFLSYKIPASFRADQRAPKSSARAEMISYSKSEHHELLDELLSESVRLDFSEMLLESGELNDMFAEHGLPAPATRGLNSILVSAGWTQVGKVKIDGRYRRYWTKTPEMFRARDGKTYQDFVRSILDAAKTL